MINCLCTWRFMLTRRTYNSKVTKAKHFINVLVPVFSHVKGQKSSIIVKDIRIWRLNQRRDDTRGVVRFHPFQILVPWSSLFGAALTGAWNKTVHNPESLFGCCWNFCHMFLCLSPDCFLKRKWLYGTKHQIKNMQCHGMLIFVVVVAAFCFVFAFFLLFILTLWLCDFCVPHRKPFVLHHFETLAANLSLRQNTHTHTHTHTLIFVLCEIVCWDTPVFCFCFFSSQLETCNFWNSKWHNDERQRRSGNECPCCWIRTGTKILFHLSSKNATSEQQQKFRPKSCACLVVTLKRQLLMRWTEPSVMVEIESVLSLSSVNVNKHHIHFFSIKVPFLSSGSLSDKTRILNKCITYHNHSSIRRTFFTKLWASKEGVRLILEYEVLFGIKSKNFLVVWVL